MSNRRLIIFLNSTKIINPGFFSSKYEVYVIETPVKGWLVERPQTAFQELRDTLQKLFPGYSLPPIPKRPLKKLEFEFINKRKGKLQLFLDNLQKNQVFRSCEFVSHFLSIDQEKEYEKVVKGHEKLQRPRGIEFFTTLDGQANVEYNASLERTCQDILAGSQRIKKDLTS